MIPALLFRPLQRHSECIDPRCIARRVRFVSMSDINENRAAENKGSKPSEIIERGQQQAKNPPPRPEAASEPPPPPPSQD